MPATPAWLAAVESLLNRGVLASAQAAALARRLDGTALRVEIEGMTSVRIAVVHGTLTLTAAGPSDQMPGSERIDATLTGTALALARLAGIPGAANRAGPRHGAPAAVAISGDAEIATSYRQLLRMARPDIEEEFAHLLGAQPARLLSRFARHTFSWARMARRTAGENLAEYLQEESRDLVGRPELEEFLAGVDTLREALDRVQARLDRLEQQARVRS